MAEKIDYSKGIYDAKQLGTPKLLILGAQHMFAMFGATVLVPLLTGLSVSTTLLCAGLGTLLFHFLCKGKVPAFLGSSFAYPGRLHHRDATGECQPQRTCPTPARLWRCPAWSTCCSAA